MIWESKENTDIVLLTLPQRRSVRYDGNEQNCTPPQDSGSARGPSTWAIVAM